ncbi:hypothetical protein BDV18DRAFT_133972 [Aspergillus unguis]
MNSVFWLHVDSAHKPCLMPARITTVASLAYDSVLFSRARSVVGLFFFPLARFAIKYPSRRIWIRRSK